MNVSYRHQMLFIVEERAVARGDNRRTYNNMMADLTHFDDAGASRMVDTSAKPETIREARASAQVHMARETLKLIRDRGLAKGDVFEVARLAGIMAAKRTSELIPLCHPLPISAVQLDFDFPSEQHISITATVKVTGRTGVEMEALTAVSIAALTVYDMCKSVDRTMTIGTIRLEEKTGGRSGAFKRESETSYSEDLEIR